MKVNLDFKNQDRQKTILMMLVGLVILVAYINFLLKPAIAGLSEINPDLSKRLQEIERAEYWIGKRPALEEQLKELKSKISHHGSMLSKEEEIPSLLEELSDMAHESDVAIIGIKPERIVTPEGEGLPFREVPISIKARCGYHRLGKFISILENAERIFAVKDIEIIGKPQSPRRHDVSLIVSTFLLSES